MEKGLIMNQTIRQETVIVFGSPAAEAAKSSCEDIASTYKTAFLEEEETFFYD